MKEITLHLTIDEINTIIEALGNEPFKKIYKLIEKIHVQAKTQTQEVENKVIEKK